MITTLPASPLRTETPQVFADKADALLGALPNFVTELNAMGTAFNLATTATSTTSNVIGTGNKTFTVATGLGFQSGMTVNVSNTGTPANSMFGQVISYSSSTLVVSVASITGSGTFTAWSISMATPNIGVVTGLRGNGGGAYTTSATLTSADLGRPLYWFASANGTLTLLDTATIPIGSLILIYVISTSVGRLTIARSSTNTIFASGYAATTSFILVGGESLVLRSDGTNWIQVSASLVGNKLLRGYGSSATMPDSDLGSQITLWSGVVGQTLTIPNPTGLRAGTKCSLVCHGGAGAWNITCATVIYAKGNLALTLTLDIGESLELVADGSANWIQSSATIKNKQVQYRQSIQYGPVTATGQADLIPQSQIGNTLATGVTLKCSTKATSFSVGQGFYADGTQNNLTRVKSADITNANLAASQTNYIVYHVTSDVVSNVIVSDVFQYGGTISVANNVFTYDYQNHIMYVGNGTTATITDGIIVAEVDTNATVVTAIRCRSYAGQYDSGFTATLVAAAGTYTKNHNMGTTEINYTEVLECTTADAGFTIGEQLVNIGGSNASDTVPVSFAISKNTIRTRRGSVSAYVALHGTTGVPTILTAASWKYKLICNRRF